MTIPKIFGVDIDGVLADLEKPIKQAIEARYGVKEDEQRRDQFYMHDRFGIDPAEMRIFMDELFYSDGFWLQAEPIARNIDPLRDIDLFKFNYCLITGRKNTARQQTIKWLTQQASLFHWEALLMDSLQTKHRALRYIGAEFLIEDRYEEALTVAQKGFRSYLIRTSYNIEHENDHENLAITWVDSIAEVIELEKL